ncbi:Toll/interleukin-1 receptor domain-containing protein [Tanacetum coccineum]
MLILQPIVELWNRLKDLFHDNKDARITQLDNEIRNMAIGNLSITDFFQQLKSKADRLANLESPVKDTSLVTYAINGVRSKYPRCRSCDSVLPREKHPRLMKVRSLMLLEESDKSKSSHETIVTQGFWMSGQNFQRGSCTYGARCKFMHGVNDLRPRPLNVSAPQRMASSCTLRMPRTTPSQPHEVPQNPTVQTQNLPSGIPTSLLMCQPTYTLVSN